MNHWMKSFGSCNAHLVAPAGCRVHSLNSPAQCAQPLHTGWLPFRSLKGNKEKVRNQTFSQGQWWQAKCKMAYVISWYSIKIIPYSKSCISLSRTGRQKILCLFLPSLTGEAGTAHLVQQSAKKSAAQGEEGGFPVSPLPWKSRTSTIAQMQVQKPTEREATCRERIFLQGRVTEGEDTQLHCHHGGPSGRSLWSEKRQGVLLPGEPPVASSMPLGWGAKPKPTGPSDHHLRAPGHLASNPANKRTLLPNTGPWPGSKVHIKPASWQALGRHRAPRWALGREKSFYVYPWPPSFQWGHCADPGFTSTKLDNLNPSLFFSGQWYPLDTVARKDSTGLLKKALNHQVLNHLIQLLTFKIGFAAWKFDSF